jgi:ligand-binding SRPBCC domain-containing protein
MCVIKLQTLIHAPQAVCFNLSRSIDLHTESMHHYAEKAIAGVTGGLIGLHDTVTWRAIHFSIPFKMTVKITKMHEPDFFVDEMQQGPFKWMRHYHAFWPHPEGTLMEDEFAFRSPMGWLGKLADKWLLKTYLEKLLVNRNQLIKQVAESGRHIMADQPL